MPTDEFLNGYYNGRYTVPEARYRSAVARQAPLIRRLLADAHPSRGRLLEVGASYGMMLSALRADGWQTTGVELDARAAERARAQHGLDVRTGTLEEAGLESAEFDAITMFHVIEHITRPDPFLAATRGLLRDGGTLLLKTPNAAAAIARRASGWWEWFAAPEHVHVYSPQSLVGLLARHGFRAELLTSRRGDANSTLFELLRSGAKRRLSGRSSGLPTPSSQPASVPVSQRQWYRAAQSLIGAAGAPLEWMLAPAYRRLAGPELLVVARAVERQPS